MTTKERQLVIAEIKNRVQTQASVSVGRTIKELMGNAYGVYADILESISAEIIRDEKYVRVQNDRDYYILLNQNPKQWRERHPFWHDVILAFIAAIFSLLVGIFLWQIDNQAKRREKQELQLQLDRVNKRLDSLTKAQTYPKK